MASVTIADGRLYTTGRRRPTNGHLGTSLIAVDIATHRELWSLTTCEGGDEPND